MTAEAPFRTPPDIVEKVLHLHRTYHLGFALYFGCTLEFIATSCASGGTPGLAKFKGLPRHTFHLHRKETEGRYNHRQAHTYQTPLRYLRENPLN